MERRRFVASVAAAAAMGSSGSAMAWQGGKPLRVGLIGAGWYGKCSLFRLLQVAPVEIVAVCDADRRMREEAAKLLTARAKTDKQPQLYGDYRELLKRHELDVCMVETPDHWH